MSLHCVSVRVLVMVWVFWVHTWSYSVRHSLSGTFLGTGKQFFR